MTLNNIINNKEENNFEYWIMQASSGRNVAECWQACYRISKEAEDKYKKELIIRLELCLAEKEDKFIVGNLKDLIYKLKK